tara:strand:+ start:68 stop:367 length:300 start_codon:yes stop_codon:yes gene_type:complete
MKLKSSIILIALIIAFYTSPAHALRCKNGSLVLKGDTTFEVKASCGQPDDEEYVGSVKKGGKYVNVERYLYIPPKGQFLKIVEFHDGVVAEIINGSRVQ